MKPTKADAGLTRREFLHRTAMAAAATPAMLNIAANAAVPPATVAQDPFERAYRWAQLTLAENDPGQFDPKFWLNYFKRTHSEATCLSAGGCVAYYPTKIPLHHRSAWMKDGDDPFGELVKGARALGMVVVARVDPHSVLDDAAQAHPEWVAVDAAGAKQRHWATPNRWVTCANGPYNFEFMTQVIREIVTLYRVDGVFANRWQGSGMCYCDFCRDSFKKFSGLDLPRGGGGRASESWRDWHHQRMLELWDVWDREIKKVNPDACFIANSGGGSTSDFDMIAIGGKSRLLAADRQSRDSRTVPPWLNGRNAKEYRGAAGLKPVVGIFSIGRDEAYRWKDAVQNGPEIQLWVAECIANGMRPWFSKFCGTITDERWLPVVEQIYQWHWRNDRYLRNTENLARVAIVYSQQTGRHYARGNAQTRIEAHDLGFHQALVEARVPFEMIHEGRLDRATLDRFKLLILPNTACLSEAQCQQLREFVQRGGGLVAAFESTLYDENGVQRKDFGLADLFGVRYASKVETFVKNSYMRVETQTKHPLLRGFEQAGRIIGTTQRVAVDTVVPMLNPPLTSIPSYPDLPMEEVYARQPKTDIPEVYLREIGKGRVVYFPGDIGKSFWEILEVDHARLLANTFHWALNEPPVVKVSGPGVLDVTVWRQQDSIAIHLVNLTNPMMMKGPVRELMAVGAQQVEVRLPAGLQPKKVRLLTRGESPKFKQAGGAVVVTVPSILAHEVVAIDV